MKVKRILYRLFFVQGWFDEGRLKFRNLPLFLALVFLWSFNWSVLKIGLRYAPPTAFVLQRLVIGTAILLVTVIFLRKELPKDRKTVIKFVPLSLIYAALLTAQSIGLVGESTGIASIVVFTQPLIVFCLAVPLLGERVTRNKILGTMLGFAGVVVLFATRMNSFELSSTLLMLLTAFLWATQVVYYKKFLSDVDGLTVSLFQLAFGVVPLMILSIPSYGFSFPAEPLYIFLLLFSSVGALALGNALWFSLLRQEDATTLSSSSLLIPAVTVIVGWQLLGERMCIELLFGSVLTLIGVYLTNVIEKRPNRV